MESVTAGAIASVHAASSQIQTSQTGGETLGIMLWVFLLSAMFVCWLFERFR